MNVIGHLACAEHLGGEIALGAMLPDLLSLYDRAIRPRRLLEGAAGAAGADGSPRGGTSGSPAGGSDGGAALREGVRFHFHVDSHFHRSELFRECSELVRDRLRSASRTPGLKRFAVGHVLAELFFDHLLIVEDPARLAGFYGALDSHRAYPLDALLAGHEGIDRAGFSAFLARLVHARFADDYLERAGLLARTDRILLRLRQRRLEPAEREAALDGLAGHAERAQEQLRAFVGAMRADSAPGAAARPIAAAADSTVDSGVRAGLK